ncbi:unnamed protein product [Trichobilharzia szidati]|nr:unnamed protein product [Trichobilharzia szidati]
MKNMLKSLLLLDNISIRILLLFIWRDAITQNTKNATANRFIRSTSLSMINFNGLPIARVYASTPEEVTPGSLVLDLSKHPEIIKFLADQSDFLMSTTGAYRYRLLNAFDSYLFRVGSKTGKITVATRLDREALCASVKAQFCCNSRSGSIPASFSSETDWKIKSAEFNPGQQCYLVAHISVQSDSEVIRNADSFPGPHQDKTSRAALVYLYLHLEDINDHTPQFPEHLVDLNIMEDTPIGSVLHYFRVTDPDVGSNSLNSVDLTVSPLPNLPSDQTSKSQQTNFLIPDLLNKPFEVTLNRDGVSFTLKSQLDRETVPAYDVTLIAVDGNKQIPRSSQISFRVHVADVNDNPPKWLKQKSHSDLQNSNYEQETSLEMDSDYPRFLVSVPEDTQIGALIFWLQARDADVGENSRLQYLIDTSAPGGLIGVDYLSVQPNTGEVRLRSQLDYETISLQTSGPEIVIPVVVHDNPRNGRQLSARATLVIRVLDINDVPPNIIATPLSPVLSNGNIYPNIVGNNHVTSVFGIWENQPPGQPVASIHVSDPDTGDGGVVTCTIASEHFRLATESSSSASHYENLYGSNNNLETMESDYRVSKVIEALSGSATYQLISAQRLDRETISRHQVLLTCRDHDAVRPLAFTYRLDIEVLDENDNPPIISSHKILLTCPENGSPGRVIGRLNATDADIGENARLHFWIDEADASWVSIQSNTGEIRVNTVFDRELEPERTFYVYVSDSGANIHTASAEVRIEILDENDHTPHFTDLYFFSIPENSPPDTEVGQIYAIDEDSGVNGKVQYFLRQPSKEFDLDKNTGKLTVRKNTMDTGKYHSNELFSKTSNLLDRELKDSYELSVYAEDSGNPPRRATAIVHISISDVNDHAPEFRYPTPHGTGSVLNISCAQLGSQIIAHVHANDSDTGRNGDIEYSIIRHSSGRQQIKKVKRSSSTILGSQEKLERSSESHNKKSQVNQSVVQEVTGFGQDGVNKTIEIRNSSNSRHVKWAPLSQVLMGGPTEEHFDIDSYSGQLFLIHPILDCSQPVDVKLLIQANDAGQPPKSSTALLTLHVYPANSVNGLTFENNNHNNFMNLADVKRNLDFNRRLKGNTNAWTDDKNSRSVYQHASFSASAPGISTNQRNMNSYHWSAIVGLIVAMIVLVLLLCLMLIILRRRFIMDARKLSSKEKAKANEDGNKYQTVVGVTLRPNDRTVQDIYNIGSQGTQQLHEIASNSHTHSTFSTRTLSHPGEEFNCCPVGTMLFEPHPQLSAGSHLFRTLPTSSSPSTATKLNTGEITLLHDDPIFVHNRNNNNNLCTIEQQQSIYKEQNTELYGYVDTQPRRENIILQGNTYQTLQSKQHPSSRNISSFGRTIIEDYSSNNNSEQIRRLPLQQHNLYKSGQYTPLIDMNHEHIWEQVQLVQASQPNLCINFNRDDDNNNNNINVRKNNNNIQNNNNNIDECSSFGHIIHRKESLTYHEKAFSLTDLNSQKTDIILCDRDNNNNNNNNKVKKSNMINYCKIKNFNKSESTSSPANNNNNTSVRLQQNDEEQQARRQQQQSGPLHTKIQKLKQKTSTVPISNKNQCTTLETIQTEISTKTTTKNLNINDTNNDNNSYCTVSFV